MSAEAADAPQTTHAAARCPKPGDVAGDRRGGAQHDCALQQTHRGVHGIEGHRGDEVSRVEERAQVGCDGRVAEPPGIYQQLHRERGRDNRHEEHERRRELVARRRPLARSMCRAPRAVPQAERDDERFRPRDGRLPLPAEPCGDRHGGRERQKPALGADGGHDGEREPACRDETGNLWSPQERDEQGEEQYGRQRRAEPRSPVAQRMHRAEVSATR